MGFYIESQTKINILYYIKLANRISRSTCVQVVQRLQIPLFKYTDNGRISDCDFYF